MVQSEREPRRWNGYWSNERGAQWEAASKYNVNSTYSSSWRAVGIHSKSVAKQRGREGEGALYNYFIEKFKLWQYDSDNRGCNVAV